MPESHTKSQRERGKWNGLALGAGSLSRSTIARSVLVIVCLMSLAGRQYSAAADSPVQNAGTAGARASSAAADGPVPAQGEVQELGEVVYVQRGDVELKGDVFVPAGDGPYPGLLMVHGGAWQRGSKRRFAPTAKGMAGHGFAVLSIDYRLASQHKFPAQLEDCRDAVRFMRREAARYKIDPKRIAGCGYSAGGHLVCLLATEDPTPAETDAQAVSTRLQAVAAGGVPCDFRQLDPDSTFLAYWLGGTRRQCPDKYEAASPRAFVSPDDPPMFLYHGQKDWLVPPMSSELMVQSLRESKVPAELFIVPDAGHREAQFNPQALDEAARFLKRTLKP